MVCSLNFQNSRNTDRMCECKQIKFTRVCSLACVCLFSTSYTYVFISGSQIPFNFDLILHTKIWTPTIANDFKAHIDAWLKTLPKDKGVKSNWVVWFHNWIIHFMHFDVEKCTIYFCFQLGNHDQRRIASRYGPTRVDITNILLKTLPGITVTYSVWLNYIHWSSSI